jgi:hypothetical protein
MFDWLFQSALLMWNLFCIESKREKPVACSAVIGVLTNKPVAGPFRLLVGTHCKGEV